MGKLIRPKKKGRVVKKRSVPFRVLESGNKVFYNFKTFTYLQKRMVDAGDLDETY